MKELAEAEEGKRKRGKEKKEEVSGEEEKKTRWGRGEQCPTVHSTQTLESELHVPSRANCTVDRGKRIGEGREGGRSGRGMRRGRRDRRRGRRERRGRELPSRAICISSSDQRVGPLSPAFFVNCTKHNRVQ